MLLEDPTGFGRGGRIDELLHDLKNGLSHGRLSFGACYGNSMRESMCIPPAPQARASAPRGSDAGFMGLDCAVGTLPAHTTGTPSHSISFATVVALPKKFV